MERDPRGGHRRDEAWPERASVASLAYRNGHVLEQRYQMSITAPPDIVALSDQTLRGMRTLTDKLIAGQTYSTWDELKTDNQPWFDSFNTMRRMMRLDLNRKALPYPIQPITYPDKATDYMNAGHTYPDA